MVQTVAHHTRTRSRTSYITHVLSILFPFGLGKVLLYLLENSAEISALSSPALLSPPPVSSTARALFSQLYDICHTLLQILLLINGHKKVKKDEATIFIYGLYLKLQACGAVYMKQIIQIEQKFAKYPTWWEADQLAIYKAWRS